MRKIALCMLWSGLAAPLAGCGSTSDQPAPVDAGTDALEAGVDAADAALWSFRESFAGADGAPWPAPWKALGGVAASTIQGGKGRIIPKSGPYALGRMGEPKGANNIEVTFKVTFEDIASQGVGFYVRQNGGWLKGTSPPGQGYAVFIEGFRGSRLGLWREEAGVEQEVVAFTNFTTPLASNVEYQVRFRVTQVASTVSHLAARIWLATDPEPTAWQIETNESTASLQATGGGIAIDSWSTATSGDLTVGTLVDDIVANAVP